MSRWNGISGSGKIQRGTGKTYHVDRAIGCKQPRKNVQQAKTHEPTKRLSVDVPVSVHRTSRQRVAQHTTRCSQSNST